MKRIIIPLISAIIFPNMVNANIDPKVTEICMKAVDFQGCVNAMTGVNKRLTKKEILIVSQALKLQIMQVVFHNYFLY